MKYDVERIIVELISNPEVTSHDKEPHDLQRNCTYPDVCILSSSKYPFLTFSKQWKIVTTDAEQHTLFVL